jgi:NADPH:quinone reductase-like Zn-dependent oxidoreductase
MKYSRVVITGKGGLEVLRVIEEDLSEPGFGEVRVKVSAAGVSFADVAIRKGLYPAGKRPLTPGYDIVGVVDRLGDGVTSCTVGQSVAALMPHFGGQTEFATLPADNLVPVPEGLDSAKVVALVLNYLTARIMLRRARLKSGERILVHGGAGGVGTALLELGKDMGLEMYATASKSKHELVSQLGASPIDYHTEDFVERIRSLTHDGVDAVFDAIGGANLSRSYRSLRRNGCLIGYGFTSALADGKKVVIGTFSRFILLKLLPDGKRVLFYSTSTKGTLQYRHDLAELIDLLAQGRINPVIADRIPLSEVARSHELIESGVVQGKIVLICNTP